MKLTFRSTVNIVFVSGLVIVGFLVYQLLGAWVNPTGIPPSENVPAPINVGSITQQKVGNIGADTFAAVTEMRSDRYCDSLGNNCIDAPESVVSIITYNTRQNPQSFPEGTACSCAAGDMLTGCSGFQRGENDSGPLSGGRQGCHSDGSTIPSCHCMKTNAERSTTEAAYWHVTTWSRCVPTGINSCGATGGTQTRTTECKDIITNASLPATSCTGIAPATTRACTAYIFCQRESDRPDTLGPPPRL